MSVLLRELDEGDAVLPLAAAVAVCEACERAAGAGCAIKWPNDVWIDGRKVAGILVEGRPQEGWAVLGIGLNVSTAPGDFPPELRELATSLGMDAPAGALLEPLLSRLGEQLQAPQGDVVAAWRERDALLGQTVRWAEGEGTAAGITEGGALVVDTAAGRMELGAGEVHLLR
jgi:BirA family biotin operon repressor/biotin-[acetyl-CoA-carboxylase] ligase